MPALGAPELIIILVIIVLIFGVGKLPEVGSALGKGLREFRTATDDKDKTDEQASATTTAAPAAAVEPPPQAAAIEAPRVESNGARAYTVQDGDTLESIARRHDVSVESLMEANGYSRRDRVLDPGDNVRLPSTSRRA